MKMSEEDASYIQFDMYLLAIDDTPNSPAMICGGGQTEKENRENWVRSVNLIYRYLYCKLWSTEGAASYMKKGRSEYGLNHEHDYNFCKALSMYSPFVFEDINVYHWMPPILCNTDFGQSFAESFGVENLKDDIYPPFIEALEDIFAKNKIAWEEGDLFDMKVNIK